MTRGLLVLGHTEDVRSESTASRVTHRASKYSSTSAWTPQHGNPGAGAGFMSGTRLYVHMEACNLQIQPSRE